MGHRLAGVLQLALAVAVALGSLLPAEHIHEGDDHHPLVAHRHFSEHQHNQTEIGDHERVIWLDNAWLQATAAFRLVAVVAVIEQMFALVLPSFEPAYRLTFDASPPHGPPKRLFSGRAPPLPA